MNPHWRLFAGALLIGVWLALFLLGVTLGGAVHLLAVAGLVLVPWRTRPVEES